MDFQDMYCKQGMHNWDFALAKCQYCGLTFGEIHRSNNCECGSDSVGHPGHDWFCPKHEKKK